MIVIKYTLYYHVFGGHHKKYDIIFYKYDQIIIKLKF